MVFGFLETAENLCTNLYMHTHIYAYVCIYILGQIPGKSYLILNVWGGGVLDLQNF